MIGVLNRSVGMWLNACLCPHVCGDIIWHAWSLRAFSKWSGERLWEGMRSANFRPVGLSIVLISKKQMVYYGLLFTLFNHKQEDWQSFATRAYLRRRFVQVCLILVYVVPTFRDLYVDLFISFLLLWIFAPTIVTCLCVIVCTSMAQTGKRWECHSCGCLFIYCTPSRCAIDCLYRHWENMQW